MENHDWSYILNKKYITRSYAVDYFREDKQGAEGTNDRLIINKHILKETKWKNIAIARIDFENTNNVVLKTWMIEWLKISKISNKIMSSIMNSPEN